jgi:hypothetical protein
VSNGDVIQLFKTVYGEMHELVPDSQALSRDIGWVEGDRVGEVFKEDVVLGDEVGITLGGSGQDAFEINPAIAGAVKQTSVTPYVSLLPSVLPFATISRSLGDAQAFMKSSRFITKNNLSSHERFLETFRIYGQSAKELGYQSYYSGTYRGAAFTNGGGTLNGVTFVGGASAASKAILLAPGMFASGIWVGRKGVKVKQLDSTGSVVAAGKLVSVQSRYGYITVDFVPVAATAVTGSGSLRMCFDGMQASGEMIGINKILSTSGELFGINNNQYELFRGNYVDLGGNQRLSLGVLQDAIANAVNGGGLEGDVTCYVNPLNWATLGTTEAGLRVYDQSYKASGAQNGFMDLEFYSQNGKLTIKAHRQIMEGDAMVLKLDTWKRSGSAQPGFKVPGMEDDLIKPLENQAGYQFKSYSDEYVFTPMPAQNLWITGINPEAAA